MKTPKASHIETVLRTPEGKEVSRNIYPFRSFLIQFWAALDAAYVDAAFNRIPHKTVSGSGQTGTSTNSYINSQAGNSGKGTRIGSGTKVVEWDDFNMDSTIGHSSSGMSYSVQMFGANNFGDEDNKFNETSRMFTNNGETTVNVKECGVIRTSSSSSASTQQQILLTRDLIDEEVPPGFILTIAHRFRWDPDRITQNGHWWFRALNASGANYRDITNSLQTQQMGAGPELHIADSGGSAGIRLGRGDTAFSMFDSNIEDEITTGQLTHMASLINVNDAFLGPDKVGLRLRRIFLNETATPQEVKEVCIRSERVNPFSDANRALMYRHVLDEPVTIGPGAGYEVIVDIFSEV